MSDEATKRSADVLAAATGRLAAEWPQLPVRAVLGEGYPSSELLRRSAEHQQAQSPVAVVRELDPRR